MSVVRAGTRAALAAAGMALTMVGGVATAYATGTVPPTTSATSDTGTVTGGGDGTIAAGATATPGTGGENTLGPAELAAQIARAQSLTDELTRSNAGIAAAATKLDRLAAQANTLLQEFAAARDAERTAREEANRDVLLFQQLSTRLGDDRRALGQWAYQAYAGGGGSLGDMGALLDSLTRSAAEASDTAAQLSYLSDQRTHAFERVRDHTALQQSIAARAVEASTRATEAARAAADAKQKLDVVITAQKAQLEATRKLHAEQVSRAGPINGLLLGSGDKQAVQAARDLSKAVLVAGVAKDGSVKACSKNEGDYSNGQVPASGLCPLYGDPAQSLRPGAAAAFNALSLAYQRETGHPVCVTDSYRSLAEQVAVKAERGMWAATPGTSEHGKGLAVDLCGGIESFGTAAHLWMKQNAPLYGWFHPNWAEPSGALPEPWHWEYAG